MYRISNFLEQQDDIQIVDQKGAFQIVQWLRDLSVMPWTAQTAYFSDKMNVRRRQLAIDVSKAPIKLSPGAMQWTVGDVRVKTGVKGVTDFFGKVAKGAITQEGAVKPEYSGTGMLVTEPTYQHILLIDLNDWNGSIVLDDGLFLACYASIKDSLQKRTNLSSAMAGNEGLFNLKLSGNGIVALESPCPFEEIIIADLDNDVIKIDGNYALAWSPSLEFTVERTTKTLIGSAASGEGLVNVYRGTGRVMFAPMQPATRHQVNASIPT